MEHQPPITSRLSRGNTIIALLGLAAFSLPLAVFSLTGSYMRLSGDDYCYAAVVKEYGFWGAQAHSYLVEMSYNGNRYSLTFFSGLADLAGPRINGALPGMVLVLWVAGISLIWKSATHFLSASSTWIEALLGAAGLVFFTLYLTPARDQILYWRSGMLPYLAPLAALSYLVYTLVPARNAHGLSSRLASILQGLAVLGLAYLAGGFSETGAALQGGLVGIILLGGLAAWRMKQPWSQKLLLLATSAMWGTLLAAATLYLSPTIAARQGSMAPVPGLVELVQNSLTYTRIFLYQVVKYQYLLVGMLFVFSACLGCLAGKHRPALARPWPGAALLTMALTGLAVGFLVTCIMVPSYFVRASYPEPRALVSACFVLACGLVISGWTAGRSLVGLVQPQGRQSLYLTVTAAITMGVLSIFPINAALETAAELPRYQKWAAFWDTRHQFILEARPSAPPVLEVVAIDHIISQVGDLSGDAGHWYNNCAARYYGIHSVQAVLPGWDE